MLTVPKLTENQDLGENSVQVHSYPILEDKTVKNSQEEASSQPNDPLLVLVPFSNNKIQRPITRIMWLVRI